MPHAFPVGFRINMNGPRFHFCIDGLSLMTEITASWSDIPGVTLTESTNVGLFVRKRSTMLFSLVGS